MPIVGVAYPYNFLSIASLIVTIVFLAVMPLLELGLFDTFIGEYSIVMIIWLITQITFGIYAILLIVVPQDI